MTARAWAIFGGSFDPPHLGHVLAAAYVLGASDVERLLVIPTYEHPFDKPLAPFEHRLRMVELAMADLARVEASALERELGGKSYTARTLEALAARHPGVELRLVIGSDLVDELASWKDYARITALAKLFVVGRSGYVEVEGERAPALPAISSTSIRARLRSGRAVDALVPLRVAAYCAEHRLYRSEP